jgi:hypothetical protein
MLHLHAPHSRRWLPLLLLVLGRLVGLECRVLVERPQLIVQQVEVDIEDLQQEPRSGVHGVLGTGRTDRSRRSRRFPSPPPPASFHPTFLRLYSFRSPQSRWPTTSKADRQTDTCAGLGCSAGAVVAKCIGLFDRQITKCQNVCDLRDKRLLPVRRQDGQPYGQMAAIITSRCGEWCPTERSTSRPGSMQMHKCRQNRSSQRALVTPLLIVIGVALQLSIGHNGVCPCGFAIDEMNSRVLCICNATVTSGS